jgi:hypothetical protein
MLDPDLWLRQQLWQQLLERTRGSLGIFVDTYTFSLCWAFADHFN